MDETKDTASEKVVEAVIDRFEGETAVLIFQDGSIAYVPRWCLPEGVQPGLRIEMQVKKS